MQVLQSISPITRQIMDRRRMSAPLPVGVKLAQASSMHTAQAKQIK